MTRATRQTSVYADARAFGAIGDGMALDTAPLQAAIDACAMQGGGTVFLPQGRYLTGTLEIKTDVTLHLSPEATIVASTDLHHYTARNGSPRRALLWANGAHNIAIIGHGTIDGQGRAFACESR
jgi:polygalacturonase